LVAFEKFDFFHHEIDTGLEIQRADNGASKKITPRYTSEVEESGHHGSTYFEHEAFVDNIEGRETRAADVEQGFLSVVVGIAAEQSLKTGLPVDTRPMIAMLKN